MDLFRGAARYGAAAAQRNTGCRRRAASPAAPSAKQAEAPPATGSGFVIQLASFRTENDARKEYKRLSSAYPSRSLAGCRNRSARPASAAARDISLASARCPRAARRRRSAASSSPRRERLHRARTLRHKDFMAKPIGAFISGCLGPALSQAERAFFPRQIPSASSSSAAIARRPNR